MQENACEECSVQVALYECIECEQLFCQSCDLLIHRNGSRKTHSRCELIHQEPSKTLDPCPVILSEFPRLSFSSPEKSSENLQISITEIFWDLFGANLNLNYLRETAFLIKSRFQGVSKIRVYGEQHFFLFSQLRSDDFDFRFDRSRSEVSLIIDDLRRFSSKFAKNVLISARAHLFKSDLLAMRVPSLKVISFPGDMNETTPETLQINGKNQWRKLGNGKNFNSLSRRVASESSLDLSLINFLKNQAYEGKVMHEFHELAENLAFQCRVPVGQAVKLIQAECRLGKLVQQSKKIGNSEVLIISLKVEKLSPKVLLWVLRSLKNDEMISTEKAIQSRLKEAFDLKVSVNYWNSFLETALKNSVHKKASSETFSLFSSESMKNRKNFLFCVKKVRDFASGGENSVIFPVNEEWVSFDQYIKTGDVFQIKKTFEWQAFVDFFTKLYGGKDEEDKAVSGGRYGCALYLKKYSDSLSNCSLGKLSYIVQLAIDEDLLRYHKTLLVWTPSFDRKCKEDKQAILKVKKSVVDSVSSCFEGISLAQLPALLKEKMITEADLSNLGIAKLKDLIIQIPDLELTQKGKNHPFVKLRKMKLPTSESLTELINNALNNEKISLIDAELQVYQEFGFGFKWSTVGACGFQDFLMKSKEKVSICLNFDRKNDLCCTSSCDSDGISNVITFDEEELRKNDSRFRFIEDLLEEDDEKIF